MTFYPPVHLAKLSKRNQRQLTRVAESPNKVTGLWRHIITGKSGAHNAVYDTGGSCPCICTKPIYVFDKRLGYSRQLTLSERTKMF